PGQPGGVHGRRLAPAEEDGPGPEQPVFRRAQAPGPDLAGPRAHPGAEELLSMTGSLPRVIAVIVTYNRQQLLAEALGAVLAQPRAPDAVIVVDNASTDGTAAAVRGRFPGVRLVALDANYGGAGGFACGMDLALRDGADLIWVMD